MKTNSNQSEVSQTVVRPAVPAIKPPAKSSAMKFKTAIRSGRIIANNHNQTLLRLR